MIAMTGTTLERLLEEQDTEQLAAELKALENGNPRIKRQVRNGLREKRHKMISTLQVAGFGEEEADELVRDCEEVFLDEYGHHGIPEELLRAEAIDVLAEFLIDRIKED